MKRLLSWLLILTLLLGMAPTAVLNVAAAPALTAMEAGVHTYDLEGSIPLAVDNALDA